MFVSKTLIFTLFFIKIKCDETTEYPLDEEVAEETQHAICKIITEEIQTSANATVKRQLKGVCTSKQLERKFNELERKLLKELNKIKALLTNQNVKSNYDYFNYDEKSLDVNKPEDGIIESVTEIITQHKSWIRTEIAQLNNTMFTLKGQKVYTYYWKVDNVQKILQKQDIHIRSDDFFVLGHEMCLQLFPNYQNTDYFAIHLRPSSNFFKKHRLTVLDQFDSTKDINSQTLGGVNTEEIYKVPYAKLQERHYLHNNQLFIKLTIYLNS